ncbi:MAG: Coenzyme F420 hydrogenase/dehydrogenase, beta subunit C-terminal domain, partial [Ruoffia tabacinasalis]
KGNNVVIVRNPEIEKLIENGIQEKRLNLDRVKSDTIIRSQAAHFRHTQDELAYRLYKKDKRKQWRPTKRITAGDSLPYLRKKVQDLREEISQQSHIVFNEAVRRNDLNYFTNEMGKLTKRYHLLYRLIAWQNKGIKGLLKSFQRRLQ